MNAVSFQLDPSLLLYFCFALLCWDRMTCVYNYDQCPNMSQCPPHFTLTTDHRCIPDSLRESSLVSSTSTCPSFMVNCPDGSCALTELLCETATVCPYGFYTLF